jgi:hypothetical protein
MLTRREQDRALRSSSDTPCDGIGGIGVCNSTSGCAGAINNWQAMRSGPHSSVRVMPLRTAKRSMVGLPYSLRSPSSPGDETSTGAPVSGHPRKIDTIATRSLMSMCLSAVNRESANLSRLEFFPSFARMVALSQDNFYPRPTFYELSSACQVRSRIRPCVHLEGLCREPR